MNTQTPIMQTLLRLVRDYGHNKAVAWLEGEEELALPDDDLTSFLSRHDVEFDQLTESDRDALRDEYLEAVKSTMSSRYTPPDSTQEPAEASLQSGGSDCASLFSVIPAVPGSEVYESGRVLARFLYEHPNFDRLMVTRDGHIAAADRQLVATSASPHSPEKPVVQPTQSDSGGSPKGPSNTSESNPPHGTDVPPGTGPQDYPSSAFFC
jgi:hypothetical protein